MDRVFRPFTNNPSLLPPAGTNAWHKRAYIKAQLALPLTVARASMANSMKLLINKAKREMFDIFVPVQNRVFSPEELKAEVKANCYLWGSDYFVLVPTKD